MKNYSNTQNPRNEIIKEFKLIDKRLIKGELVGVSYSYILGDISFNGQKKPQ